MKKILFIFICILSTVLVSSSQSSYQIAESIDFFRSYKMQKGEWSPMLSAEDIEGSPFLNNKFINGTIFTTTKTEYQNIPIRYNIFNDEIEFKTPDNQIMAIAAPEGIEKVEFGDVRMVYIPYMISKKIKRGYFKELVNGKVLLYAKPNVMFKEAQEAAAYVDPKPPMFLTKPDTYFLRVGKEEAKKIDKKNDLIEIFPDHKKEISSFIKKNKIKTNKEETLTKLVNYYNSL